MFGAIVAAIFTALFIDMNRLYRFTPYKPFNCTPCLSAWLGLIYYFIPQILPYAIVLFIPGVIAPIIKRIYES